MKKSFAIVISLLAAVTNALPQSFTIDSFTKAKAALVSDRKRHVSPTDD